MAEDYVYPDTTDVIDGVEVVKVGVEQWTPNYQGNGSATLYTTHEAYEGNGACLLYTSLQM